MDEDELPEFLEALVPPAEERELNRRELRRQLKETEQRWRQEGDSEGLWERAHELLIDLQKAGDVHSVMKRSRRAKKVLSGGASPLDLAQASLGLWVQERYDEAEPVLRLAIRRLPSNRYPWGLMVRHLSWDRDPSDAIAFVEDIESTFAGVFRILKPGGKFILSDMNPLQYIIDEIEGGMEFNHIYPYKPILLKWRWEFDELKRAPGFQHYVRSIPHYHNALTAAGFTVSKILEPQSTVDTPHSGFSREIMEEYRYIAEHIPITFIIVCLKP